MAEGSKPKLEGISFNTLRENRAQLEHELQVLQLLPHLSFDFRQEDEEDVKAEKSEIAQARKFLDIIPRKGDVAFQHFLEALKKVQPHLFNFLLEKARLGKKHSTALCPELDDKHILPQHIKARLRSSRERLEGLSEDIDKVISCMKPHFTQNDVEEIQSKSTKAKIVDAFVSVLQRKGTRVFNHFVRILRELEHDDLANYLTGEVSPKVEIKNESKLGNGEQQRKQLEVKRKALIKYKFGSKTDPNNVAKLVTMCGIDKLRIGVFGPRDSGKSCFINACERTVRNVDKGTCLVESGGGMGTIVLEEFLTEMFFRLVDTLGFSSYDEIEICEFKDILSGRIKKGDVFHRVFNAAPESRQINIADTDEPLSEKIHGIIFVLQGNSQRLKTGDLEKRLQPFREIMKSKGFSPVTVVTSFEANSQISESECVNLAFAATGSRRNHTFISENYCDSNPGPNVSTEMKILDILHLAILNAERYVKVNHAHFDSDIRR